MKAFSSQKISVSRQDGSIIGQFAPDEILQMLKYKTILPTDSCWSMEIGDWELLQTWAFRRKYPQLSQFRDGLHSLLAVVLVGGFALWIGHGIYSMFVPEKEDERDAQQSKDLDDYYYKAEYAVKKLLVAPSTASFSNPLAGEGGLKDLGDGYREAYGYVDAQNGFGAKIRNQWSVQWSGQNIVYVRLGDQSIGTDEYSHALLAAERRLAQTIYATPSPTPSSILQDGYVPTLLDKAHR